MDLMLKGRAASNGFKGHEVVIILGREQPSPRDAERRAMAVWYDTKRPIRQIKQNGRGQAQYPYRERQYTIRDGGRRQVRVR
jgi:Ni/Co efflux regulator RcnB